MRKLLTILLMIVCLGVSKQSKAQSCSTVPVINSFSPNTGFIGSKVTIFGANFDSNTITNNVVYFGSTKATVVSATFGQLVVIVPVGASTAPISVTNQCNRTAYSTVSFNGIFCPTPLSGQTYQNVAFDLTGIYGAYNMISQDLDLDGKPEVISSANNGGLTIAVNNSTPGLLSFSAINSTAGGQSIYAADFDGDGKKDLLSTYQVSRNTSTLGNVSMASSQSIPQVSGYQIAAGDFNNDGKIDIIGEVGSNVMIAFNTSTGPGNISFGPAQFFGSVGTTCTGIQVADIDGDGKTDFIASQGNADRAVSIRNTTTVGSMTPSAEAPEYWSSDSNAADGLGTYPYRAQIADFDKDGKIDFTSCNYNGATNVAIWRNISSVGNITFAPTVNLDAPQNNYRIGVGDVDGDGYPDVVTKSLGINVFSVYKNTSTGAGAPTFETRIDYTSSNQAEVSGIVIGDLDGDFVPDIATSGINSNRILFHRNTSFQADNTAPTAIAQNIVAALAPNGTVTVTAAQVDNGSSDACGIKTITLSQTLFTCANIGANPVTLTVTDNAGNVSTANAIVNVQPAAIIVAGQTTVCQGGTIPLSANLGDSYQWYNNGVIINGATNQNYTATQTGSYTVAVTNAGGCSGTSLPTVVTVNNNPVVAITGKTDAYCPGEALIASQSSLYQWSKNGVIVANATQREFFPDGPGTYSVAVIDLFGCSATSGTVTISPDTTIPTIVLNGAAQVTIGSNTVFNDPTATANDNCSTTIVVTSNLNLNTPGVYTISYKAVDGSGNESVSVTRQVTVLDATAPVVKAGRVTVQLDANGQAIVVPASLNNGSTDNGNGTLTFSLDKSVFDCTNLNSGTGGTLTPITSVGSVYRRNFSVGAGFNPNTGEYWMPEWAGSTVYRLDVAGNVLGSFNSGQNQMMQLWMDTDSETDYYTANWTSNYPYNFTRINGNGQKVWTYNVANGNYASGISTDANFAYVISYGGNRIDVLDKETGILQRSINLPGIVYLYGSLVVANDHIYFGGYADGWGNNPYSWNAIHEFLLDGTYVGSISTPDGVYNASFDGEVMWVSSFSDTNYGFKISDGNAYSGNKGIEVVLTATDAAGNSATDVGTVVVEDKLAPTISLNGNQVIQVVVGATFNDPGANAIDNCSATIQTSGSVNTNLAGNYTILYKAIDGSGNESAQISRTVQVIDLDVKTKNITVKLKSNGTYTLDPSEVDNGSILGGGSLSLNITQLDCSNVGNPVTVIVTATSSSGNTATGTAIVTVVDEVAPIVSTQNVTIQLNAEGLASISPTSVNNGSTDACGIASFGLSKTAFDCSNIGSNAVILTVIDVNGNISTGTATVTVQDNVAPVALAQNVTIQLNASGNASITIADINNGSSDACGIASIALSKTAFDCSNIGNNTVTLTVTDVNGNVSTATATVTVVDNVSPIVLTQNVTIQLNAEGLASISPSSINNGSTDNCGIASLGLNKSAFDCSNVGNNTVTLTVTDVNGNVSSATATVTVVDNVSPIVLTQNATIQLNAEGLASISPSSINNGSTDNCGIASIALSKTAFDCSNIGNNTVTLTVTDVNGNVSTATATVTVVDNVSPIVLTQNVTIQLNAEGLASIAPSSINNGSTDNCSIASIALSKTAFDCSNVGNNTVTLTVTDVNGNVSTATATVTVQDNIAPFALTQNVTIQLNASGSASITTSDINNGSSDACGIASIALNKTAFDCSNVGANTVTLTVTDVNGNVSTATSLVTVQDKVAPIVLTQNRTIQLNASGNASITAADINNGSTDNCSIASIALSKTAFDCTNVGANTVTLTVTDVNGNVSTATSLVTVEDKVAPIVLTQNRTIQLSSNGSASITAADINNGSTDNCSIASIALSKTAFDCTNVGANTVTLTVTDVNGNVSTAIAVVTVEDKIAPIVTPLAFQELCFVASNTYSLPSLTATDNCSIASVSYVLSGATSRIGLGSNASGTLNTGLTTITWTVRDVNGNVSTSSNDVRIWPLPVLTITPSNADAFCNEVSLSPSSTIPVVAYRWMYNNTLFSSSAVLKLSIANADGNYQLFVTDIHGCVNTQIASYNFQKQGSISSYTILGLRDVKLGENNRVLSGSVGAMGYKGKIDIKKNSSVAAAGAFVKAADIKVQSPSNVPTKIYAPVVTSLPTMQYFTGSTKNLAKVTASTNTTLTGNYKELTVKAGKTVTLTGNLFGKVKIEEGATVTFSSSVINIEDLDVEGSSKAAYTNVIFSSDAVVKVSDKVDIEKRSNVNPTGKKVIFYVGSVKDHGKYYSNSHDDDDRCPSRTKDHRDDDDDDDDHEGEYGNGEFKVNGGESIVNANVYVPNGKIKVNGGEKLTTSMTGMFIAYKVESSEKNVNWNSFSCSATTAPMLMATNSIQALETPKPVIETASLELLSTKFLAYPNPFARQTTVSFTLPYQDDNATIDIYDLRGVKVQTIFKGKAAAQTPTEVQFNGQNIAAGTYFFRLTTGLEVKNFKVIMGE